MQLGGGDYSLFFCQRQRDLTIPKSSEEIAAKLYGHSLFMNHFLGPILILLLASCSGVERVPYTPDTLDASGPKLAPASRFWADSSVEVQRRAFSKVKAGSDGRIDVLALSGGGPDGAFGAGVLSGWTETGNRPFPEIVTGVSIGAIIAPIAFLGPDYDKILSEMSHPGRNGFRLSVSPSAVSGIRGLFQTKNIQAFVETIITKQVISEIVKEHDNGRRLYVATANIDAQRMSIWDIGAIASADPSNSREIIVEIIVAAASIPAAFPAQAIRTSSDTGDIIELHADAGTIAQVWIPDPVLIGQATGRTGAVWALMNISLEPDFKMGTGSAANSSKRAIGSIFKAATHSELRRSWSRSDQAGYQFRLAYIRPGWPEADNLLSFDAERMKEVFEFAWEKTVQKEMWIDNVPAAYTMPRF